MKLAMAVTGLALVAALIGMTTTSDGEESGDMSEDSSGYRTLTAEEERVIVHAGTEAPFTGEYDDFWLDGTYHCKRCGALLYDSGDKFHSGSGWPSFDSEVEGTVERRTDPDGMRVEIVCANCGAHLGHVFEGEGFTETDTRHCVNSISLVFRPRVTSQRAIFAGGCFWGVEDAFEHVDGVIGATSGYTGGTTESPSYYEVCSGTTGHAEAVEVVFDPAVVGYEELARLFFEIHDPTTRNRQGPDVGSQYRSAVFYATEQQRETAERLIGELEERGYDVVTEVEPATEFWPAEDYHQDYFACRDGGHSGHARVNRFDQAP